MNVELPRQQDLDALAPDKDLVQIGRSMRLIRDGIAEAKEDHATARTRDVPSFSPAGQATQMIVGATAATDRDILSTASSLYATEK
jgi:predicted DNA-binding helix-hairpin-helix protein